MHGIGYHVGRIPRIIKYKRLSWSSNPLINSIERKIGFSNSTGNKNLLNITVARVKKY